MVSITANEDRGISALFTLLEQHKADLGFEYYSVSQTTLDQVFLSIVGKHDVKEEGERDRQSTGTKRRRGKIFSRS
jgi:coproporphyrinogen III oxidase